MSFEALLSGLQRLSISVEALAAVGAQLRLQQQGLNGNPRVRPLLKEVVHALDPQLLENVDANQQAAALALIQEKLRANGFEQIEVYSPAPPIMLVVGRRPASH